MLPDDLASRAVPGTNKRLSRQAVFAFATTAVALNALAVTSCSGTVGASYGFPGCTVEDCSSPYAFESGPGFDPFDVSAPFDAHFYVDSAIDAPSGDTDVSDADGEDAD